MAAESIVADLAAGLVGKLASLAAQEVIQVWNLKKDLEKLGARFSLIGALLNDAHKTNITLSAVKDWFDQLEDAAHVTEAFMDELSYEVTRRNVENRHKLRDCFIPSKNTLMFRFKVARKIKSIHASYDNLYKSALDIGFRPAGHLNLTVHNNIYKSAGDIGLCEDTKLIVGRDEDISYLVQTVCNNNEQDLPVVATGHVEEAVKLKMSLQLKDWNLTQI